MPRKHAVRPAPVTIEAMIAEAAYYKAAERGFVPGHELSDWLAAEAEIRAAHPPADAAPRRRRPATKPKARTNA